jgi:hypothetical protein
MRQQVGPYLPSAGGNVIISQIENEYNGGDTACTFFLFLVFPYFIFDFNFFNNRCGLVWRICSIIKHWYPLDDV